MSASENNGASERPQVRFVTIDENNHGQRIDNFLVTFLKGVPKGKIYNLLRKGEIRVNKKRIKPDFKLSSEDIIRIAPIFVAEPSDKPVVAEGLKKRLKAVSFMRIKG